MVTISPRLLPQAQEFFASVPDEPQFHTLSVPEQRSSNAAFMATIKMPDDVTVSGASAPGKGGSVELKIYAPRGAPGQSSALPVVIYLHGGGWVIGSNASHAPFAANLASQWSAVVVAVDYRLAPEHPFPAAVEDTWAALEWASQHAGQHGGNTSQLIVAGESAGGNLSAVAAQMAKDSGLTALKAQVLVCMGADLAKQDTPSYKEFWTEKSMTAESVRFWVDAYVGEADPKDPKISPIYARDFAGLAPAFVATTEVDVLCSEGEEYANRLKAAGVPVEYKCYKGLSHNGVFNPSLYPQQAQEFYVTTREWLSKVLK